jgi:hypothetical protein
MFTETASRQLVSPGRWYSTGMERSKRFGLGRIPVFIQVLFDPA